MKTNCNKQGDELCLKLFWVYLQFNEKHDVDRKKNI